MDFGAHEVGPYTRRPKRLSDATYFIYRVVTFLTKLNYTPIIAFKNTVKLIRRTSSINDQLLGRYIYIRYDVPRWIIDAVRGARSCCCSLLIKEIFHRGSKPMDVVLVVTER